jgi:hypothetical protein
VGIRGSILSCEVKFDVWDATHYLSIIERGYFYVPNQRSNVAFFPLYPFLARGLVWATGLVHNEPIPGHAVGDV